MRGLDVKRIIATIALALMAALAPMSSIAQSGLTYVPLGYCQLTSLGSAVLISTCSGGIPSGATMVVMSIEGTAIRYRDDGTAPTASIGMPVGVGQALQYSGTLSKLQIIQQSASATANFLFYR